MRYNILKLQSEVFGGYFEVEINISNRNLKWRHYGCGSEENFEKKIRISTVDKLIKELKSINVFNWNSKYVDMDILDGTQWELEIEVDGGHIKKHGSNMFPDSWNKFCELIRKTSGKRFS